MNEEKLDKIYEKLLEFEIAFKDVEREKELKRLEQERKNMQYRIDDLKYIREKELENKEEMMAMFRNLKTTEEE